MTIDHLLLVDCSAFAYRAYYSQPELRRVSDGEPTGAVLGFMSMIWRLQGAVQADPPTLAAAVFDAPGGNFRHTLMPSYKGNRDAARSLNLEKQLPLMRPVAEVLGMTPIERKGFEADDIIATMATMARAAGIRTTIVSSDKDFGQLVVNDWIEIVDPMARARNPEASPRRREADVIKKFGVPPHLVPDVQALAGDTADGIPGVKGIGYERAAALVRALGPIEKILANTDQISSPRERMAIRRAADRIRLYKKLTFLRRDIKLKIDLTSFKVQPIVKTHLIETVKAINPSANITALFGLDRQNTRLVARMTPGDALEWWQDELAAPGQMLPQIPQCGFYQRRLAPNPAPFVPARIWREPYMDPVTGQDTGMDVLKCEVNGKARDPMEEFTRLSQHPIKESEYRYRGAKAEHARNYRPDSPEANPYQTIDLSKQPVSTNPRKRKP